MAGRFGAARDAQGAQRVAGAGAGGVLDRHRGRQGGEDALVDDAGGARRARRRHRLAADQGVGGVQQGEERVVQHPGARGLQAAEQDRARPVEHQADRVLAQERHQLRPARHRQHVRQRVRAPAGRPVRPRHPIRL
ncbi:hypothetical protein [Nocardia farcinica]|uniref:hypothetical protein n=1 Tax=Nocardia farcinica TaxID=37329 RepID=UPI0007A3B63F|nr:hypothetical protein [Nocardia farcinica]